MKYLQLLAGIAIVAACVWLFVQVLIAIGSLV